MSRLTLAAPPDDDILLTRKQAAKLMNMHPNSLVNLERDGTLKPIRLRRSVRYFRDDLVATLRQLQDDQSLRN